MWFEEACIVYCIAYYEVYSLISLGVVWQNFSYSMSSSYKLLFITFFFFCNQAKTKSFHYGN